MMMCWAAGLQPDPIPLDPTQAAAARGAELPKQAQHLASSDAAEVARTGPAVQRRVGRSSLDAMYASAFGPPKRRSASRRQCSPGDLPLATSDQDLLEGKAAPGMSSWLLPCRLQTPRTQGWLPVLP